MRTVLVVNSKGGCGKTTVTTNLAGYFASSKLKTAIMDYDPQGSSLNWLRLRSPGAPKVHGANAAPARGNHLIRSLQNTIPDGNEALVIDAPSGAKGLLLQELLRKSDMLIVPVSPSAIDIHATADFIKELLLSGRVRARNLPVGVVANRVRSSMPVYEPLERFLTSLNLPFLARLSDSDNYVKAAEKGLSVFELEGASAERSEFAPIAEWIDRCRPPAPRPVETDCKILDIADARRAYAGL